MFGNGDLIEIDAAPYHAIGRVRGVDGVKLHIAYEQGGYLPWTDDTVRIRRSATATNQASVSFDARILHTSAQTALIEILGQTPLDRLPPYVPPV